jgi:LPS export ABC transporter protein LptC
MIAMVLLTTVSFWVNRLQHSEAPEPVTDLDPKLNYVLRDFELQFFDENGTPTINLQAPVFRNDPDKELGTIENPSMKLNQPEFVWDLTADAATVTADKEHVQLLGQVHVRRQELATGYWVELETSEVQIEVTPQTATTSEPVNVYDGQNQASAVGLGLDLKSNTFYLKEQVKATYAVN